MSTQYDQANGIDTNPYSEEPLLPLPTLTPDDSSQSLALPAEQLPPPSDSNTDAFAFDKGSGISEEDQREILAQIEQVATENQIEVSDDVFALRASKNGVVFPIVINFILLFILTGGIATFALLFRLDEKALSVSSGSFSTTEGLLLEELKRESAEQLQAKALEIEDIQNQLANIAREREDLEANMNGKIAERESQLRQSIDQELADERQRLRAQGVSEDDIQTRLRTLEEQKNNEFGARISEYRSQAEAERRQIEESLQALQSEYNQSLSDLNTERAQLLEDSQRREQELQSQLDLRTQELEQEKTSIEEEFNRLSEERQREELVSSQLIGMYNSVKSSMRERQFSAALETLSTIGTYLNEEGIIDLPAVLKRREVEFFVIESLRTLAKEQQGRTDVDVSSVVAQANLIANVRDVVARADAAATNGDVTAAERLYTQALSIIPDIGATYGYLTNLDAQREAERQARLDGLLAVADIAYREGRFEQAMTSYQDAFAYLPKSSDDIDRIVTQLGTSAHEGRTLLERQQATQASLQPLSVADQLLADGRIVDAAAAYLAVLTRYPNTNRFQQAIRGVQTALSTGATLTRDQAGALQSELQRKLAETQALQNQLEEQNRVIAQQDIVVTDLRGQIEQLEDRIAVLDAELATLNDETIPALRSQISQGSGDTETLRQDIDRLEAQKESLETQLEDRQNRLTQLTDTATELRTTNQALTEENTTLRASQQMPQTSTGSQPPTAEIDRLVQVETTYKGLQTAYSRYSSAEDQALSTRGQEALVESKLFLDDFLTSSGVQKSFPGLWDRIKRFDRAFEDVGRQTALQDVSDLMYDLSFYASAEDKTRYLEEQIQSNQDKPALIEMLTELRTLIQQE